MLRLASSRLGMSPHHTMQVAERLYTQGYMSYPRTETTQYPANFDYRYDSKNIFLGVARNLLLIFILLFSCVQRFAIQIQQA